MAPELQLLVSQLSFSLKLPLRTLELELLKLVLELWKLVSGLHELRLGHLIVEEEENLLMLGKEFCRLETEFFELTVNSL